MLFWTNAKVSPKWTLNKDDVIKTVKNTLIFLGPTLLVLIPAVIDIIPKDWAYASIIMWLLKGLTELIQRFLKGK